MSYIKNFIINQPDRVQHTLSTPADLNVGTRIPCNSVTIQGISNSNGQLVIDSGKSVLLTAGAYIHKGSNESGYLIYQWYDVTNSTWLGRSCIASGAKWDNNTRYKIQQFARCVLITSSQTTVELRIKEISNISNINEYSDGTNDFASYHTASPWYSVLCF